MNEVDVRIVPAGNRGIDAYKDDVPFEIIPPDAVSTDIQIVFVRTSVNKNRPMPKTCTSPEPLWKMKFRSGWSFNATNTIIQSKDGRIPARYVG